MSNDEREAMRNLVETSAMIVDCFVENNYGSAKWREGVVSLARAHIVAARVLNEGSGRSARREAPPRLDGDEDAF